jgi:FHS family L-fucose permease-like MFS transporter
MTLAARSLPEMHDDDVPLIPRQYLKPFLLVTGLFFLWAIPNNLNDVLIRQFMKSFEISRLQAGLVQSSFYTGYFLFSMPAAILMRRYGYKCGLLTGLLLYSAGTFLFLPAALMRSYYFFLLALFVIASGLGFLETGANPLIAQMGDPDRSVQRLNFSQAFNPLGAICGVLIGTFFIFSGVELSAGDIQRMCAMGTYDAYLQHETMRVIIPYLFLGVVVLLWALMIARTHFPEIAEERSCVDITPRGGYCQLLAYPHFLLAIFALFCYEGAQVGTWSYFIQYVQDYSHQPEKVAGHLLTGTLVGFGLGRFVANVLMNRISAGRLMGIFSLVNIVLVAVGILFPGWLGIGAIFITSFFMSLMFPTIFALGLNGLGKSTKSGASVLVMAIIGGAFFTPLVGLISQYAHSMALAMIVPLLCYIVVAFYGFRGCHLRPRLYTE